MKSISSRQVRAVLSTTYGLRLASRGNGSARTVMVDSNGRRFDVPLSHKDVAYGSLYNLGRELEAKGITTRRAFLELLKAA